MDGPNIYEVSFYYGTDLRHSWEGSACGEHHALQRALNDLSLLRGGLSAEWCTSPEYKITVRYVGPNPKFNGGI
jgi:hypothetical protein